jgi:ABC-type glutathione transport system ATPase component
LEVIFNERKKQKKSGRKIVMAIIVLIASAFVGAMMLGQSRGANYTEVKIKNGDITTYYSFSGSIEAKNRQTIFADKIMQIAEILVMNEILNMQDITKCYYLGGEELAVLINVNLKVNEGDFLAVLGPSGSGKSTLMNIIGCLDAPTSGEYVLAGENVKDFDERELARIRNRSIGFIFQSFQLLPRLNALENIDVKTAFSNRVDKASGIQKRNLLPAPPLLAMAARYNENPLPRANKLDSVNINNN